MKNEAIFRGWSFLAVFLYCSFGDRKGIRSIKPVPVILEISLSEQVEEVTEVDLENGRERR